jgi:hypothetical protein
MADNTPKEYPFKGADEKNGYRLFPNEMENDDLIAFHGTAGINKQSITDNGFTFAATLQSLSFAKSSAFALIYACNARSGASPNGCVLAVRFDTLERPGIVVETSIIHVYDLKEQPKVIGYCVVPATYCFV